MNSHDPIAQVAPRAFIEPPAKPTAPDAIVCTTEGIAAGAKREASTAGDHLRQTAARAWHDAMQGQSNGR